ncbi:MULTISPECIES: hypothetical protein [Streptosporangium]|uniref:Uncharacterized protein n=1 Tax=Streptosporangium brasiliense TaxID=47480 RepID=A0ABT9RL46_9ACTN|nr:hypothetical protein [Streptosporangium brasiliense]MDP9870027.1 hypothetical protein [Streptosporangium brasiliense]
MPAEPAEGLQAVAGNSTLLQWVSAILANATVVTALLVYFGWERSDVMARRLGINESILGMSTSDYVLRSVRPVLVLLLIVGAAGFAWLYLDHWLTRVLRAPNRLTTYVLRTLSLAWLVLPALVWLLGYVPAWRAFIYVAFPFSIGAGVLLAYYAAHVRASLPGGAPPARETALRAFVALSVGFSLFWGTSHYATVLGNTLADGVRPGALTKVTVYSPQRLHLTAPGVVETPLQDDKSTYRYRYTGLRLLDHTGGRYFLISDAWTRTTGVVVVLADKDPVRMEFAHA